MRSILTVLLFLGITNIIPAQVSDDALEAFLNKSELKHATVGFSLLDENGMELAGTNSEKSAAPASTLKLLTSITALEVLGHDHKFVTTLNIQGTIIDGRLIGNVIIKSGGDPTLGSANFLSHYGDFIQEWVTALKSEGITKIDGRVLIDDNWLSGDRNAGSTALNDVGNYYGAGAPGFSILDNEFEVYFNTAGNGSQSTVSKTNPPLPECFELVNQVKAGKVSGDNVIIYSLDGSNQIFLKGLLPAAKKDFRVRGSIPDVSLFAEEYFISALQREGVTVTRESKEGPLFMNFKELVRTKSPALIDILKVLNHKSVNTYADVLLKHIGKEISGDATFNGGSKAVLAHWSAKGIDVTGVYVEDGSGLSRKNNITPKFMTEVLRSVTDDEQVNKMMNAASLSSSVKSMWGEAYKGQIQAKSGYIGRVRAYSGYLIKNEKKYPFYLTINNFPGSASKMRKLMGEMLRGVRKEI